MDPGKILLAACVFTVGLVTWAESLSINANDLIFSDDLDPQFLSCRSWVQVCDGGESIAPTARCTTHREYAQYLFGLSLCPLQQQSWSPTVSPGKCAKVNGRCSFSNAQPSCVQSCRYFSHECTTVAEFFADPTEPSESCHAQFPKSSSKVCIPDHGECAWRNPCVVFQDHCDGEYMCGSEADYALFLTLELPPCAPPDPLHPRRPSLPPGECLYQDGQCKWSDCRSWLSACGTSWTCGTTYEFQLSRFYPLPPCAYNPLSPIEPGRCEYNMELGKCAYSEECDGGKEFQECGSPCPQTCNGISIPDGLLFCSIVCLRGCFCPTGTVLHQDQCIPPHQCPGNQQIPRKG